MIFIVNKKIILIESCKKMFLVFRREMGNEIDVK